MARLKAPQDILMEPKFTQSTPEETPRSTISSATKFEAAYRPLERLNASNNSKSEEREALAVFFLSHSDDPICNRFTICIPIRPHVGPH